MPAKKRQKIIAGNWKMNKTIEDACEFIRNLAPLVAGSENEVKLAVPYTALNAAANAAKETNIQIGAQNMHETKEGAYTGEISGEMLLDAGATFVILGHSERRYIFGEGNRVINKKLKKALEIGLQPMLCIGETGHEREKGLTEEILKDQLTHCLEGIDEKVIYKMQIAYEPVWAIGTGHNATPDQAQEMHSFCRNLIASHISKEVAERLPILYGGSVKPSNTRALLEKQDIDGVLVGGASLSVDSFSQIVNYLSINV